MTRVWWLSNLSASSPAPLAADAQEAGKVYRIGFLGNSTAGPPGASRASGATPRAWRARLRRGANDRHRDMILGRGLDTSLSRHVAESLALRLDRFVDGLGLPPPPLPSTNGTRRSRLSWSPSEIPFFDWLRPGLARRRQHHRIDPDRSRAD